MKSAIYPGSFDPVTYGHIDVIKRASRIYDSLTVAVLDNRNKRALFSVDERVRIIRDIVKDIPNISVTGYEGLLVDFAKEKGANVIIRGLRAVTDFEYDLMMAQTNKKLDPSIETMFITTALEYAYLSSSTVKEVASFGGDISRFVPPVVAEMVYSKYENMNKEQL